MTVKDWRNAELFYNNTLFWLLFGASLIIFAMMIFLFYFHKRTKWLVISTGAVILIVMSGLYTYGNVIYSPMKNLLQSTSPSYRTKYPVLWFYSPYDKELIDTYKKIDVSESLRLLDFYTANEVKQEITYFGRKETRYYFDYYDRLVFTETPPRFTGKTAFIQGEQFVLNDPAFESIGFVPETNYFFRYISVPDSQKDLILSENEQRKAVAFEEVNQVKWATIMKK